MHTLTRTALTVGVVSAVALAMSCSGPQDGTTESGATVDDEEPRLIRSELEAVFVEESTDEAWAAEREDEVRELVDGAPDGDALCTLGSVECRTSVCKVVLDDCSGRPEHVSQLVDALQEQGGFGTRRSEHREEQADGQTSVTAFFSRGDGAAEDEARASDDEEDCQPLEFRVIDDWQPYGAMERVSDAGLFLPLNSEEAFRTQLGVEPPASLDFDEEWALLLVGSPGEWARERIELGSLEYCPAREHIELGLRHHQAHGCERTVESMHWVPFSLVAIKGDGEGMMKGGGMHGEGGETFVCRADGAAEGEVCTHDRLCNVGLICAGLTRAPEGTCVPFEHRVRSDNSTVTPIPDNDATGVKLPTTVSTLPGQDADVIVRAELDHPNPEELQIELLSPENRRVTVCEKGTCPPLIERAPKGFEGEPAEGEWTLIVTDAEPGNQGQVESWGVTVITVPSGE